MPKELSLQVIDLPTFKAKLLEFNIFVWKEPHGLRTRIHGIERSLGLPPKGYELTYEQPQTLVYNLLKTDRDWHYAVEYSKMLMMSMPMIMRMLNCSPYGEHAFSCPSNKASNKYASEYLSDKDASAYRVAMLNIVIDCYRPSSLVRVNANCFTLPLGNAEIGNGYGVPGGCAYYGNLRPLTISFGGNGNEKHESGQNISEQPKQNSNTKDLPEFLKQFVIDCYRPSSLVKVNANCFTLPLGNARLGMGMVYQVDVLQFRDFVRHLTISFGKSIIDAYTSLSCMYLFKFYN
ncbi:hypothetical protein Tco_0824730 [Tanacetum coccineum]|uniref:Uncharacterized protein n=1 Tax=Tanacetum coccineum TaxID=301880 RepID=A0ABQ5ALM0_9ASTR